jgi:hypothetical protein
LTLISSSPSAAKEFAFHTIKGYAWFKELEEEMAGGTEELLLKLDSGVP